MEQQIGQWVAIGIIVAFMAIEKALKIVSKKNNKSGSNPHPCAEHGERLKGVETDIINIKEDIRDIKGKLE